jgi:hypothetical protein
MLQRAIRMASESRLCTPFGFMRTRCVNVCVMHAQNFRPRTRVQWTETRVARALHFIFMEQGVAFIGRYGWRD